MSEANISVKNVLLFSTGAIPCCEKKIKWRSSGGGCWESEARHFIDGLFKRAMISEWICVDWEDHAFFFFCVFFFFFFFLFVFFFFFFFFKIAFYTTGRVLCMILIHLRQRCSWSLLSRHTISKWRRINVDATLIRRHFNVVFHWVLSSLVSLLPFFCLVEKKKKKKNNKKKKKKKKKWSSLITTYHLSLHGSYLCTTCQ